MNYFMYTSHHYQYLIFQLTSVLNSKPVADSNCFSFPFRVGVIGFLLYLLTNLHKQADFWQVNIFHLFLSRYSNQSHNFITLIFARSSLSSLLLFRVDGQKQSKAAMFGRRVFFGLKTEEKNLRFQTKTDTCVVYGLLKFPHLPSPGNDIIQALLPGTYFRLSENPAELHEMRTFRRWNETNSLKGIKWNVPSVKMVSLNKSRSYHWSVQIAV